jgi:choline dehydrogenase
LEDISRNPEVSASLLNAYMQHKAGPLTGGLTGIGFASMSMVSPDMTDSDVSKLIKKAESFQSTATRKQLKVQEDVLLDRNEAVIQVIPIVSGIDFTKANNLSKIFSHPFPGNWVSFAMVSTHMLSRGSIHIKSANPAEHPAIDPNYYSHPLDVEMMARAIMHARQFCRTEPLSSKLKNGPDGDKIPFPGFSGPIMDPKTLDEAIEFVKYNTVTCYHPIATCSMLPREEGGVVDSELKVYGTANVRVVDASVFPLHIQGNIMSVVYAVAEKAADMIKGKSAALHL